MVGTSSGVAKTAGRWNIRRFWNIPPDSQTFRDSEIALGYFPGLERAKAVTTHFPSVGGASGGIARAVGSALYRRCSAVVDLPCLLGL